MSSIPLSYDYEFEKISDCSELQKSAIDEIAKEFEINTRKLNEIVQHFRNEMNKGLTKHGQTVAMVPSYGKLLFKPNFTLINRLHSLNYIYSYWDSNW